MANTWYSPTLGRSIEFAPGYKPPASEGWVQGSGGGASSPAPSPAPAASPAASPAPAPARATSAPSAAPAPAPVSAGANTTSIDPTQSTLSPNFASYIYNMLGRAEGLANLPFQEYTGQRFAGPSALQEQAFQGLGSLQLPGQFGTATDFLTQAGRRAADFNYAPQNVTAPTLNQYQMQGPRDVRGSQARAAQMGYLPQTRAAQFQGPGNLGFERVGAERVNAPSLRDLRMEAATPISVGQYNAPTMSAQTTGYQPNLQTYQMGPAERISTQGFDSSSAQNLMSPYMRNVVDIQKREAQRQADIAGTARGAKYAQAGAFGGARQAIENAEAQRNLATQMGDIEAQGLQSAYDRAMQQFNAQQQQSLTAQQANQQAGLTTGQQNLAAQLGVQQLGTQTGLQTALANLTNQQQAAVQNQAAQLQTQGMNAQQALQAALANQQNQQQANLQNLSAGLQTQGLGAQTGLQAQQLNQASGLQALLANQQAGINTGQFNAQQAYNTALQNAQLRQQADLANMGLAGQYGLQQGQFDQASNLQNAQLEQQANLANQQMGYNVGQQNLNALLGVQNLGAGQDLQAQLANQQAGQFGANLGLQANQQLLSAGQGLGGLGASQYGTQLQGLQALLGAGATQQGFMQQPLDFGYQQFQESQKFPYQQGTYMQSMLQGMPLASRPYDSGASGMTSALQGGLSALGLFNALGGK